jgi:hypothetical protein
MEIIDEEEERKNKQCLECFFDFGKDLLFYFEGKESKDISFKDLNDFVKQWLLDHFIIGV